MPAVLARGEEVMTDKQFDSIIEMVIQILSRASDLEDAKSALLAIKRGGSAEEAQKERRKRKKKTDIL